MNCPFCGAEMEKGILHNRGGAFFLPEDSKRPALYTQKALEKANAIPLPPDPYSMGWNPQMPTGYCCRKCRKIILEY